MDASKTPAQLLFEQVVKIVELPRPKAEPTRPTDSENEVCRDHEVSEHLRIDYKTPLAVLDQWAKEQKRLFGDAIPLISIEKSYRPWGSTAHLEVETVHMLNRDGLRLHFSVSCNPRYMAQPSDLIPVFLERPLANQQPNKPGDRCVMVVVIEPTWDCNHWEIKVDYSLPQVAKLLQMDEGSSPDDITRRYRELALRAQWYGCVGQQRPQVNGVRHESGGLDQKGGSGKLRLVPYTLQELAGTEGRRNTAWNMSEKLNSSRPVFNTYESILQAGKEMMTSLECESEYKLSSEGEIDHVIDAMHKLHTDLGLQQQLGIVKMEAEHKKYEDTYFDLPGRELLSNRIVLRRRHRGTDAEGTYLFALKGATHADSHGRRLRLAAQVQLKAAALNTTEGKAALRRFLSVSTADNAMARTMLHALANAKPVIVSLGTQDIVETLVIESERETFTMKLADGTQIDFSADKATGKLPGVIGGPTATVYSFEFGVGHPALTSAATGGGTVADDGDAPKKVSVKDLMNQFEAPKPQIVRPYHIPEDLTNPELFAKDDYKHFTDLRNAIVVKVFGLDPDSLELGGNKAHDLAKLLDLIK